MTKKRCCYGLCGSDSRYADRPNMANVFWIPFPKPGKQLEKCRRWVHLCGRKNFGVENITKNTYICSKHFNGENGPTEANPDPLPTATQANQPPLKPRPCPRERGDYVPPLKKSKVLRTFEVSTDSQSIGTAGEERENVRPTCTVHHGSVNTSLSLCHVYNRQSGHVDSGTQTEQASTVQRRDMATQTDKGDNMCTQTGITLGDIEQYTNEEIMSSRPVLLKKLFLARVLKDDQSTKHFTGLPLVVLLFVFNWIKEKAGRMNYWHGEGTSSTRTDSTVNKRGPHRSLNLQEEFLLTLIRLRRGMDIQTLADIFAVSPSTVSRVFLTWINLLYLELQFFIKWPSREQVRTSLPRAFKPFPKTRVIIDCTEFFVEKPSLPSSQRKTWSSYKHHNTFKSLIGISPKGAITYVSPLYTGNISDRRIVKDSGFLDNLSYGDDVMADRGFLIRDLLADVGATLNIPPFANGRQLSSLAATKTRRIARARIHVERSIRRLKGFRILSGIIPLKMKPCLNQITFVCAMLSNLQKRLVPS